MEECAQCGTPGALERCGFCADEAYCGYECAAAHWISGGHGEECAAPIGTVLPQVLFKYGKLKDVTLEDWLQFNPRDPKQLDRVTQPPDITSTGFRRLTAAARKLYPSRFQTTTEAGQALAQCERQDPAKEILVEQVPSDTRLSLKYRDIAFDLTVRSIDAQARTCDTYKPVFGLRVTSFDATAEQIAELQAKLDESVYLENPFNRLQNNEDVDIVSYRKSAKLSRGEVAGGFQKNESGVLFHYRLTKRQRKTKLANGEQFVFSVTAQPVLSSTGKLDATTLLAEGTVRPLRMPTEPGHLRLAFSNQRGRQESTPPMRVIVELRPMSSANKMEVISVDIYLPTVKTTKRNR